MTVHVLPIWVKNPYNCPEVNTTSSSGMYRELSPFILGPIDTYIPGVKAKNFENLWQFSKVYSEYLYDGAIYWSWFAWRDAGWADKRAHRYPMGKGRRPAFSYWAGERLGYIEARKLIYATIYAKNVIKTNSYARLVELYKRTGEITLKEFDAYDHLKLGMTLVNVINNPNRKMGHGFVLAMLLEGVLKECLE